jgi:hypothetical protein
MRSVRICLHTTVIAYQLWCASFVGSTVLAMVNAMSLRGMIRYQSGLLPATHNLGYSPLEAIAFGHILQPDY